MSLKSSTRAKRINGSNADGLDTPSITLSSSAPSRRKPLVRSYRARSSGSTASSHHKKSSEGSAALADELAQLTEPSGGLTPSTLAQWILSKGQDFGSVYLIPFAPQQVPELETGMSGDFGYCYRIAGSAEAQGEKHFYTLSTYGVNEFFLGDVRFIELDKWLAEYKNYERLRVIPFFLHFKMTKSFQTWKRVVKRQKFISASQRLKEGSCIFGNTKMRHCFLQVQTLVGRLTDMGVTEILPRKTYDLNDFFSRQLTLVSEFANNFGDFRNIVCQLVIDTCKATFSDAGFHYEDYSLELAYTQRQLQKQYSSQNQSETSSVSSMSSHERPKKLTFIEQVNKRKVCENLVRFVRLVDFMLRYTAHMIVTNSLIAIQKALVSRAKSRPTPEAIAVAKALKTKESSASSKESAAVAAASDVDADTEIPVFSCKISVQDKIIGITPNLKAFEEGFHDLLAKLNDAVQSVPILFDDTCFNPFTQPILYGKIENYKQGVERSPFIRGHQDECASVMTEIKAAMVEAFDVCDLEMELYKPTAREFCEVERLDDGDHAKLVDVETDVDSLKSKLSNLTDQQTLAKGIKDTQNVSIFRADFRPLKRTILPNISKTIIRLQDALPKLGREKMENFNEECKSLKDMIDFELKTSEDFVNNMDIKEKMSSRFEQLKTKLEGIENVYLIMKNIPVPVSTEDKNSLKNLKSQLKSVGSKVQDKIKAHADILERFAETLEKEQIYLKESVASLLQEVRSPALLELEATADEVKPTLAKIEQMLKQASAKVLQYNQYEKTYGFHITEYLELVAAGKMLAGINTVWKCTEDWEVLYTKWASVEFSQLDVDDCEEGTAMMELELEEAKEVVGASPMSQDLMNKVNATTQRLPVLKDLRTEALKERHWKQISEVVGADLTTSGKKITMEVLDKYNVFNFGREIGRIVKAATQEEQLDCMVNDLRNTWTERKLTIKVCHGISTVCDFNILHNTINSSIATLKELGQSRYSSEMKDSLLYWCDVVEKADLFVGMLAKAQNLWMFQEVPLSSMLIQDEHPSKFTYFKILRAKFEGKMRQVAEAGALISAFGSEKDYHQLTDIHQALKETEQLMGSVLWSLRSDSPRLFFLATNDLLHMLFEAHNDLPALYQYIDRIFPSVSSIILVDGTDLTVNRTGYHPEIKGVISKDGESIQFSEVMKVRLGVEHWVKCIGLHLRFTLRSMARSFSHDDEVTIAGLVHHWKTSSLSTQILLLAIHSSMCKLLATSHDVDLNELKSGLEEMKISSIDRIKSYGFNQIKKYRETAKLFQLEYYTDLLSKCKNGQELLDSFLVKYCWEKERQIYRVSILDDQTVPFGYEYNGQGALLNSSHAYDKVAYNILASIAQGGITVLKQDVRKVQLKSLCLIYGRPFYFVSSGGQGNFKEALVGGVVTNTWIYIQADDQTFEMLAFLRELSIKAEIAKKFDEHYLEILGEEIELGRNSNIFIARTSLLYDTLGEAGNDQLPATGLFQRFRQITLNRLPVNIKIRMALLARGVSDKGLGLFLCIMVDRFMQLEGEAGPQCLEIKMLNAIKMSINTSKLGILQKFLTQGLDAEAMRIKMNIGQLVLDEDVYDIIKRHAKMSSEFKTYFEDFKNPSMAAASASQVMVENCILLQTSVSNFAMTCVIYKTTTNTVRRTLRATASFLHNQTGCIVYEICGQTQLGCRSTLDRILEGAKESTGVLHVYGTVAVEKISMFRTIAQEYTTLKIMFSCNDEKILKLLDKHVNCIHLKSDPKYDMLTSIAPCLNEKIFGIIDKHFPAIFPFIDTTSRCLKEQKVHVRDGSKIIPTEKSVAIAVGTAMAERAALHDLGSMLTSAELVCQITRASIYDALPLFCGNDETAKMHLTDKLFATHPEEVAEQKEGCHPLFQKGLSNEDFEAQIRVCDGQADVFVPTKTTVETIKVVHFYLLHHSSVLLLGQRGCGKSLVFNKVVPRLAKGTSVKYLILGKSSDFSYEVNILRELTNYRNNIVVIENFDPKSVIHCHFVTSLMTGRSYFDERTRKFIKLPNLTLFVEVDCSVGEVSPVMLHQMTTIHMAKVEDTDRMILSETMTAMASELPCNVSSYWEEIVDVFCRWHKTMRDTYNVSDHTLFRTFTGILAYVPEDIEHRHEFLQYVYSEMIEEYSVVVPMDENAAACNDLRLLPPFADIITDDVNFVVYHSTTPAATDGDGGTNCQVRIQTLQDTVKKLTHTYHFMKGKAFNDRLVFSSHYSRQVISLVRSFCRFGTISLVGPPGCGKRSTVSFCAQLLEIDLVECPKGDLINSIKEAYTSANAENPKMLYIDVGEDVDEVLEIFDLLNKIFFYYDIPGAFSKTERMCQLFDDQTDRYEALLDNALMIEAISELTYRIKDNLHVVVAMTPKMFGLVYRNHVNFFIKSGTVRMIDWPEETLVAVAEERFVGLEQDLPIPVRNVSKTCAILHLQMMKDPSRQVSSTQYLDMVKILPLLYKPLQKKLLKVKHSLQTGIDQVHKANTFINKLTNEISEKEPEVLRLNSEIEQLNKRLSQERINLERASKAFRKKEVAARKKSEDTQKLAADAHRNLEHALPSLDAAMQAINSIDKAELMELRAMKNPPEAAQQVVEAVCILLGMKADWPTAKLILGDPQFTQKLLDFDKDNIPDQVSKRVRRYIDNPKFIPDEVAKVSKICCSMCMWVRAIDLYTKIFKSIEPKRIRLLQAESELAEAMAALREETDRVAHIESTITSIQSNYQERVKRKANLEASIKQTSDRLERAQLLSYSLEEESERWKTNLIDVDKSLQVLVGNSVVAAMIVAYSGCLRQIERLLIIEKWRKTCDRSKLETTVIPANEFLSLIVPPLKHWIGKFEFYCQNYLSIRVSKKWPLLHDPHGLAMEAIKAQNENIVVLGMQEERLVETLRQAITKGHEVLVHSFDPNKIPLGLQHVFHRKMTERIHAFVGLMGIPIMRKDHRVLLDGMELVCNPKFKLMIHFDNVSTTSILSLKKIYNVVIFDYSDEALEQQLLKKVMVKIDPSFCKRYEETMINIRHLEHTVLERKDNVLDILLKSEEDVLDDKGVIVALKDAKAKVFEILNDLNQERKEMTTLEEDIPQYKSVALRLKSLIKLLDLLAESEPASPMPKTGFVKLMDDLPTCSALTDLLPLLMEKVLSIVLPSLRSKNRYLLQLGCNVILATKATVQLYSSLEILIKQLFDIPDDDADLAKKTAAAAEHYFKPENENDKEEEMIVRDQLRALEVRDGQAFGRVINIEQTLITNLRSSSQRLPVLLYTDKSCALDAVEVIADMAKAGGFKSPQYVSADNMPVHEMANLTTNCQKERRWLIIDSFHQLARSDNFSVDGLPTVSAAFRLFFLTSHDLMPCIFGLYNRVVSISLTHAPETRVRRPLFFSLLCLRSPDVKMKSFYDCLLRLHEFMAEGNSLCTKYCYVSALAKKWQNQSVTVTPQKLQNLIAETYGYNEHDDEQLLHSILREISYSL